MEELNMNAMQEIIGGGGSVEEYLCQAAFWQLSGWTGLAFGLASLTGAGVIAGLVIGAAGVIICTEFA